MMLSVKSLIRLRVLALFFIASLATSCGFTPLHAPAGAAGAFGNMSVELGPNIKADDKLAAFWVQQRLAERLGSDSEVAQILEITPSTRRGGIGISGQDVATRYDFRLGLKYKLTDAKTGKVLDRGTINSVSTYTATNDPYALIAAEESTTKQLASDTADRLLTRLAGYFASKK